VCSAVAPVHGAAVGGAGADATVLSSSCSCVPCGRAPCCFCLGGAAVAVAPDDLASCSVAAGPPMGTATAAAAAGTSGGCSHAAAGAVLAGEESSEMGEQIGCCVEGDVRILVSELSMIACTCSQRTTCSCVLRGDCVLRSGRSCTHSVESCSGSLQYM
jgi:hypothetical protein